MATVFSLNESAAALMLAILGRCDSGLLVIIIYISYTCVCVCVCESWGSCRTIRLFLCVRYYLVTPPICEQKQIVYVMLLNTNYLYKLSTNMKKTLYKNVLLFCLYYTSQMEILLYRPVPSLNLIWVTVVSIISLLSVGTTCNSKPHSSLTHLFHCLALPCCLEEKKWTDRQASHAQDHSLSFPPYPPLSLPPPSCHSSPTSTAHSLTHLVYEYDPLHSLTRPLF